MKNKEQMPEPQPISITTDATTSVSPACTKPLVMRCYYDDNLCGGKIMQVGSFKKYLCEKCKKEDDSVCDEPLDTGYHAMDTRNEWD